MPEDKDGLIIFLSSDIFPKVGEKTAEKIVDTLGNDCLSMISNDYECLLKVPKMTEQKAIDIQRNLNKYNESYETVVYLTNFGFNMKDALKIYNHYLEDTIRVIENNPYELIDTIDTITFNKIDSLRNKTGVKEDDERRLLALIINTMKNACFETGDTYLELSTIYNAVRMVYEEITEEKLNYYLMELNSLGKIIIEDNKCILSSYYNCEDYVASLVYELSNRKDIKIKDIDIKIERLENFFDIKYNNEQKKAIKQALIKNFSIITGGPGTGKTTIIKAVVDIYEQLNPSITSSDITLLAPTGRASKRLSESVLRKTSTIHKFLKWNKETKEFSVNRFNPVKTKLVIIDEVSMVDIFLFNSLLDGLVPNIKLILVGDANQLPSIAPGNILKDLLEVEKLPKIYLTEIYRTKKDSYIISLSTLIKERYEFTSIPPKHNDFNFINTQDLLIRNYLTEILLKAKEKDLNIDNLQVLVPMYKGENGIDSINALMQDIFNKETDSKNEIIIRNTLFREQDKVIQLVNDVDNNIYNGDIGYISRIINSKNPIVEINYNGNIVSYTKNKFEEFSLAYAISVHKSQGSEYDNVILVLPKSMKRMLYNKLIYTAVTRAKKSLIIVGSLDSLNYSIKENTSENRLTSLKTFFV